MQIEKAFNTDEIKRFYFPGRIVIGRGVLEHSVSLCRNAQGPAVAIVDAAPYCTEAVANVLDSLRDTLIATRVVRGRPISQEVEEFVQSLATQPTVVLAIGGGSTSDFAKAVVSHFHFGAIDGVGLGGNVPIPRSTAKPLLIAIPTTAGSGAEASRYYVTYDRNTQAKVFGRSWALVADWILLDPELLATTPLPLLVGCAFDAFVHFFETLIAKHERSPFGEMLSLDGIPRIMGALNELLAGKPGDNNIHQQLLYGATLSGVAISNVRTGHIHEAAGALLELVDLSHPETLFVFFRDAAEQYLDLIGDREELLVSHLRLIPAFSGFSSLDDVITWWESAFAKVGLDRRIREAMATIQYPLEQVQRHVFERVYADKVWINKECPVRLDEQSIADLVDKAFGRFGAAGT